MGNEKSKIDDQKLKLIMDKLDVIEDNQNIMNLDIINLKNEIDKLKLVSSASLPEGLEDKFIELEKLAGYVDIFKQWKQTVDEVKFLRELVMKSGKVEIDSLRRDVENLKKVLISSSPAKMPIDIENLKKATEENKKAIESLKSMLTERPETPLPENIETLKSMIRENRDLIEEMKLRLQASSTPVPKDVYDKIDSIRKELTMLENEIERIKQMEEKEGDEIERLKRDLKIRLGDLKIKSGVVDEDIKEVIDRGKNSIEKLKMVMPGSSRPKELEELRRKITEHGKILNDLKKLITSRKERLVIPPEPEFKKKMLEIEQRIEALSRKLEKMNQLKPISVPDVMKPDIAKKIKEDELEKLRKEINKILKRMDEFVTKDDVFNAEKGILSKRISADEKLVTDKIYQEFDEIKKAIVRNEDQIINMASDLEKVKKEIEAIEDKEWGEGGKPDIGELKKKVDKLEEQIKLLSTHAPLYIE
ncbi:MAG: hypothetical protein J7K72_03365 [Candidatus Aenigmarchaeota archaeon]|nr:hypothetical protein [Candidatus Aenigmarchaeota archaeon]